VAAAIDCGKITGSCAVATFAQGSRHLMNQSVVLSSDQAWSTKAE
jgi:hypothetical protein